LMLTHDGPRSLQAPPPPPSLKSAALEIFTRNEVRPRTTIICSGGFEGAEHQHVCLELAQKLAKWQPIAGAGVIAPFCSRVCWRSCEGQGHTGGLDDGYLECPHESCATESCIDFLKAECPPAIHAQLDSLYNGACTLVPPSPPMPPLPPPAPPFAPAPQSPPPKIAYTLRQRDTEQEWDGECELVSYAKCREIVKQYADLHGTADVLSVSFSPCQGLPVCQTPYSLKPTDLDTPIPGKWYLPPTSQSATTIGFQTSPSMSSNSGVASHRNS
jgi:hypothetical protein